MLCGGEPRKVRNNGRQTNQTIVMKNRLLTRRQIAILAAVVVAGGAEGFLGTIVLLNLLLGGSLF